MSGPLWCLVVDLDQKPVGDVVSVTVSPGTNVFNVKEAVLAITGIETSLAGLSVWRCFGLKLQGDEEDDQVFKARVRLHVVGPAPPSSSVGIILATGARLPDVMYERYRSGILDLSS